MLESDGAKCRRRDWLEGDTRSWTPMWHRPRRTARHRPSPCVGPVRRAVRVANHPAWLSHRLSAPAHKNRVDCGNSTATVGGWLE